MKLKFITAILMIIPFVTQSQILWDDFEQNRIGYYDFVHGGMTTRFENPDPMSAVNNSELCAQYVRNPGEMWDVLVIVANGPLYDVQDYIDGIKKIKVDVFSPIAGIPVQVTLEDSNIAGATNYPAGRHSVYLGTTTVANAWETIELTFDSRPDPTMSNTDITSLILLFNPGTNTNDTYYFDNLYGPEFDNQCDGLVNTPELNFADWDCNWNLTYGYMSGWLNQVYNPEINSINSSKYVGEYTRNPDPSGEDVLIANFTTGSLDLSTNNIFRFKVYGPPRPFIISFQDENENEVISFNSTITNFNMWQTFVYDLSSISSQQISRFVLIFDQGVVNWDTYFIDDFNISSIPSYVEETNFDNNLVVFPNPSSDKIKFYINDFNETLIANFYDINGINIISDMIVNNKFEQYIDVSDLCSGTYFVELKSTNLKFYKKIQIIK